MNPSHYASFYYAVLRTVILEKYGSIVGDVMGTELLADLGANGRASPREHFAEFRPTRELLLNPLNRHTLALPLAGTGKRAEPAGGADPLALFIQNRLGCDSMRGLLAAKLAEVLVHFSFLSLGSPTRGRGLCQ